MITMIADRCRRTAGLLALVLMVVLVTVHFASGQITVTGAMHVERAAVPGETYQGAITIRNTSNTVQVATLSLADYRFAASGSSSFDAPGSHERSSTGWITLSQNAVSVPPMGTQVVGYTVAVPAGTSPTLGSYWSVVLVEGEDRKPVPADAGKFTITPKMRYAVQLVTHLGQTGECQLAFGDPHVKPGSMVVDITGSGTRACRPALKLEVYNSEGVLKQTATLRGSYLYPSTSVRQTFDLTALTPGAYNFVLLADVGVDKLQGVRFQVQVR